MVDPANASELALIAQEVGAAVITGDLTYPSETGGWQLGDLDLSAYLAQFKDKQLTLIIAPVAEADAETFTCGICGFVRNELGECPRCTLQNEENANGWRQRGLLDDVRDFLGEDDDHP